MYAKIEIQSGNPEWGYYGTGTYAYLFIETDGTLKDRNMNVTHCFLYIPEEALEPDPFSFNPEEQVSAELFLSFNRMFHLKRDIVDINFGCDRQAIAYANAYLQNMEQVESHKNVSIAPIYNEFGQDVFHIKVHEMIKEIKFDDMIEQDIKMLFNVHRSEKELVPTNSPNSCATKPQPSFDIDFFKNKEVKTLFEDAEDTEVQLYVMATTEAFSDESIIAHHQRKLTSYETKAGLK